MCVNQNDTNWPGTHLQMELLEQDLIIDDRNNVLCKRKRHQLIWYTIVDADIRQAMLEHSLIINDAQVVCVCKSKRH